jgi:probable HAF family extracellular repeat protein
MVARIAIALAVGPLFVSSAGAKRSPYAAIDLGTLGGASSGAVDINASGQIAGTSDTADGSHAFLWTRGQGMRDLPGISSPARTWAADMNDAGEVAGASSGIDVSVVVWTPSVVDLGVEGGSGSGAVAVNNAGQVAGNAVFSVLSSTVYAFAWTPSGGPVYLAGLGKKHHTVVRAENDAGQVVGESSTDDFYAFPTHAFSWTAPGGMADLGTLGAGAAGSSSAVAVNQSGQVAGMSQTSSGAEHAFSWTTAGGMVDLGTLGGTSSHAAALNDAGQIVGRSTTASGDEHAFSWSVATGMIDLGTLGGASSRAVAVNVHGQVVGTSETRYGEEHAFFWTADDGMVDLGKLGGSSSDAVALNASGEIAGTSTRASGIRRAVLWTLFCIVPDVRGDLLATASRTLHGAGCATGDVRRIYSKRAKGHVVAQSPRPSSQVPANSVVRLTVSKGRRHAKP